MPRWLLIVLIFAATHPGPAAAGPTFEPSVLPRVSEPAIPAGATTRPSSDDPIAARLLDDLESQRRETGVSRVEYDTDSRVVSVMLSGRTATAANLVALRHFPSLEKLSVLCPEKAYLNPGDLTSLGELTKLKYLRLYGAARQVNARVGGALAKLPRLSELRLIYVGVNFDFVRSLAACKALRAIEISWTQSMDDPSVAELALCAPPSKNSISAAHPSRQDACSTSHGSVI